MAKIVIMESINRAGISLLEASGHEIVNAADFTPAERMDALKDADGLLVRILPITEEMMAQTPQLKIISKHGVGVDNIDLKAAAARNIVVSTTPGANAQAVAEHAVALMMTLAKNIIPISRGYREVGFKIKNTMEGVEFKGKTLGIIGCGDIGSRVARIAAGGLAMRVLVYDPYIKSVPEGCELIPELDTVLREADFLTLHSYLSDETFHMIDEAALARLKPTAFLINCARGPIVDEPALLKALEEKRLAGAGLDVTEEEPLPADNPLFAMPNVILTPHYAPSTKESAEGVATMAAQNLLRFFEGKEVAGRV